MAGDFCLQLPENMLPLSLPFPLLQPSQSDSPPSPQSLPSFTHKTIQLSLSPPSCGTLLTLPSCTPTSCTLLSHTPAGLLWQGLSGGGGRRPEENHTSLNTSAEQGHAAMGADSLHFYWCSSLMLLSPTFHHHLSATIYLGRFCSRFKVITLLVI